MTENILSARFDKVDSHTLQSYQADGGYLAAKKALTEFEPSAIIEEVIKNYPGQVAQFKTGKEAIIKFLIGMAMKASEGSADPGVVEKLLRERLHNN